MAGRKGFDLDLKDGQMSEGKLGSILAMTGDLIEVKRDFGAVRTGNIYVEVIYQPKGKEAFEGSGLTTTEATWWAVEYATDRYLVLTVAQLRLAAQNRRYVSGGDDERSVGVLIPLKDLVPNGTH